VYAEAVGQGISADSHDIVQPEPEGRGISHALQSLLDRTDLDPAEIVHVNAHATSTPAGDIAELKALRKVFGDDADHMAVSATKSGIGRVLGGGGGGVEAAGAVALHSRRAPPPTTEVELHPQAAADAADVGGEAGRPPVVGGIAALHDSSVGG